MLDLPMTILASDGTPLAGTLTLPDGPGPFPAALMLQGSGPLDRDGNTLRLRMDLGPSLASALAAAGIASLRYDRRGTGRTPGSWRDSGFTGNREDAAAALHALADRPEIQADSVSIVGHSEGAVHGMAIAVHERVCAVVLLAGYARTGESALRWQIRSLTAGLPAPARVLGRVLEPAGQRALERVRSSCTPTVQIAGSVVNARWMREMLVHDSRHDLAAIPVPVLAVTGDKDIQVDPDDLEEISRLVPGEAEVHWLEGLTHLLRRDPGRHTIRSYRGLLKQPVDAPTLQLIVGWLARHH
ncbi:alpha/beta fold hydrolase [Streptomyces sp. NPDC048507]|uniref:alpha/beta fold hydrolase n=1 Tax=Streptomyces sp. NPDC048507 TaxID=3365560 RepID=UPI003714CE8F